MYTAKNNANHKERHNYNPKITNTPLPPMKNDRAQNRCYNCGEQGHLSSSCEDKHKGIKCFKCNKFGHISKECKYDGSNEKVHEIRSINITRDLMTKEEVIYEDHTKQEAELEISNDNEIAVESEKPIDAENLEQQLQIPRLSQMSLNSSDLTTVDEKQRDLEDVRELRSFADPLTGAVIDEDVAQAEDIKLTEDVVGDKDMFEEVEAEETESREDELLDELLKRDVKMRLNEEEIIGKVRDEKQLGKQQQFDIRQMLKETQWQTDVEGHSRRLTSLEPKSDKRAELNKKSGCERTIENEHEAIKWTQFRSDLKHKKKLNNTYDAIKTKRKTCEEYMEKWPDDEPFGAQG